MPLPKAPTKPGTLLDFSLGKTKEVSAPTIKPKHITAPSASPAVPPPAAPALAARPISALNPQEGIVLTNHVYQYTDSLIPQTSGSVSYRIKQIVDTSSGGYTAAFIDTATALLNVDCNPHPPTGRRRS